MAAITYTFVPEATVWHLTDDCGIKKAIVKIIDARVLEVTGSPTISTVLTYSIQYVGENGTVKVEGETRLFATLAGTGSPAAGGALAAYQTILEE